MNKKNEIVSIPVATRETTITRSRPAMTMRGITAIALPRIRRTLQQLPTPLTVGSRRLEYGSGTFRAGFPSSLGFGVGGQSCFNVL